MHINQHGINAKLQESTTRKTKISEGKREIPLKFRH